MENLNCWQSRWNSEFCIFRYREGVSQVSAAINIFCMDKYAYSNASHESILYSYGVSIKGSELGVQQHIVPVKSEYFFL